MIPSLQPATRRICAVALALLLLAALAGAAAAARSESTPPAGIVRVTAGEHDDFSRVVFALGAGLGYRTEVEPGGLRVVFPDALVGFEYDEVYPKRRAHRVIMAEPAMTAAGASLRLKFGCECTARTFALGQKLVVDVFGAAAGAPGAHRPGDTLPEHRTEAPAGVSETRAGGERDRLPLAAAQETSVGASGDGQPRPEFLRRVQSLNDPEPHAPRATAEATSDFDPAHLERMLAWAIENGHLTGAGVGEDSPRASPADRAGRRIARPPHLTEEGASPTARDAALSSSGAAPPEAAPSPAAARDQAKVAADRCPAPSMLDMATLAGAGDFVAERGSRHDALSRALAAGHGIQEAQLALAAFYIARLMPQEALGVLDGVDAEGALEAARAWLEAAALVLADRSSEIAAGTLQESACRGADARLWRAVVTAARGPLPKGFLEGDAIPLRLAGYPPDLRIELGLRLAQAAVEAQAPEAVAQLLDLVEQAAPADEARARLLFLRGRLAASRGDFAGAEASWRGAAALPGEGGVRATLALVAAGLERGDLDEAAALFDLERLAYDWRGHPLQLRIARLTAAVHEQREDLPRALAALEEVALGEAGRPIGRAAAGLATDLMRRAYADASGDLTVDQMAAFWRYEGFVPSDSEGAGVRLAFARALIAHGLPGPAIGLLKPIALGAPGPHADDAVDLLAEGYLRANQPEEALELLRSAAARASAPRSVRNRLAAQALAALGQFAEAAGVLHGEAGDDTARLQADYLWKAGLWSEAARAYRTQLQNGGGQDQDDVRQAAIRLAAAAHMAGSPGLIQAASRAVGSAGGEEAASAFAPLPAPAKGRAPARTAAAQLLEQSRGLAALAEQYGLGTREGE